MVVEAWPSSLETWKIETPLSTNHEANVWRAVPVKSGGKVCLLESKLQFPGDAILGKMIALPVKDVATLSVLPF